MKRALLVIATLVLVACGSGGAATAPPGGSTSLPASLGPITTPPLPSGISLSVRGMLQSVATYIVSAYAEMQANRPNNPHLETQYRTKLTMLAEATLIAQIFNGRQWVEGTASTGHGAVPVAAVFPSLAMQAECVATVRLAESYLPVLVEFFHEPFPTGELEIWYGFKIGASGGGGALYLEDRTTYEGRWSAPMGRFDPMVAHEIAHTYMGNEALTQFLEIYTYNVARGAGVNVAAWTETRGWTPVTPSTYGATHPLDIYHRVGFDVMRRAYRAIRPLRPAYGQPLSAAVIAAFLSEVPAEHREFVEAKLRLIVA